jgi:hypothetical protein
VPPIEIPGAAIPAITGVAIGLWLLVRGLRGHVVGARIRDTATSSIGSIAVGEVRVAGIVEPAELLLTSPLQSRPSVWYRARIRDGDGDRTLFAEDRSVGFRVRDASGSVRVFPAGASWDVPPRFEGSTGMLGDAPPGLHFRTGSAIGPAAPDREQLVAALLTVRRLDTGLVTGGSPLAALAGSRDRSYEESRIEPGDTVTILGGVLPFADLVDPVGADFGVDAGASGNDPEIAADLAEARAAGTLAGSAEEAWGNAAIPGFGIGRPVREPELHPEADAMRLATADEQARTERVFDLGPDTLVLAAGDEVPLVIAGGAPEVAVARHRDLTVVGLLGAILAIGSAMVLAAALSGRLGG